MFRNLRIHRPLVFLDVETTGVSTNLDRIIEIALLRFAPGERNRQLVLRCNPEQPIPPAATAIHGIADEHVASCPTFAATLDRVTSFIADADLAGFGIARFDLPILAAEYGRAGQTFRLRGRKVVDALSLFHRQEPRDLSAAVRKYCGRELEHAHRASHDVVASAEALDAMLGAHCELPREVDALHGYLIEVDIEGWFRREGSHVALARGKYVGQRVADVAHRDPAYLRWIAERAMCDAQRIILAALSRTQSTRS
jgi:DNA polymerase-3 subunit epsilon